MSQQELLQYQKLSDIEQALLRPQQYVGSMSPQPHVEKCFDSNTKRIVFKDVTHPEAAAQLFLEIIANASDNAMNTRLYNEKCKTNGGTPIDPGCIECSLSNDWCIVKNYGKSIPIAIHPIENIYIPQMIFGMLRTSSNYDDNDEYKTSAGCNGYGSKMTNILSKQFIVECSDPSRGLLYRQTWSNNMRTVSTPIITQYSGVGYTQISYSLDFPRFGIPNFDLQAKEIYMAHCCTISYTCGLPIFFNGEKIEVPTLFDYAKLYFDLTKDSCITFTDAEKVYDVVLADTPDQAILIALVNGIMIKNGGIHTDEIMTNVVSCIKDFFGKSLEGITLTRRDIVNHVSLFISARLIAPEFKNQVKDYLSGLRPRTGPNGEKIQRKLPSITIPEKLINNIKKWNLILKINEELERKQFNKLKKTDGKSRNPKIPKLDDANYAKDPKTAHLATLLVCEGTSASGFLESLISFYPNGTGRNIYGIFPLKGKMLNALNANFLQILNNEEFNNLKKALGLEEGVDYKIEANRKKLRYSQLIIVPDSDADGIHVCSLCVVFFLVRFYSLVEIGFIKFLRTPILTVKKGSAYFKFYTQGAYETWKTRNPDFESWTTRYYKGLGSSNEEQIKEEYLAPKLVRFYIDADTKTSVELAFKKTETDKRKQWLNHFFNTQAPDLEMYTDLPISTYINYELVGYSIESITRAIPEAYDGLKESQRKALFTALKRLNSSKKTIKVAQIASAAAEVTLYKHGESALADTIVLMAQNYIGSNNLPFFSTDGLFGNRRKTEGSNPRYIYVGLNWWIPYVFRKEDRDLEIPVVDEGAKLESESFFPILPLHVINGVKGIATGYSCTHHPHNPLDIAFWLQCRIMQALEPEKKYPLPQIKPWVKGWTGQVELKKNGFITAGRYEINTKKEIVITELPMYCCTLTYEHFINSLEEAGYITSVAHNSVKDTVKITLKGYTGEMDHAKIMKKLKLIRVHSYSNMTVVYRKANRKLQPVIYSELTKLLEDFFLIRLGKYAERKQYQLTAIQQEISDLTLRAKFIHLVNEGQIVILKRPKAEIHEKMTGFGLPLDLHNAVKASEFSVDRVNELIAEIGEKQKEYQTVVNMRPEAMWYNDLEEFIVKYCSHEKVSRSSYETMGLAQVITEEIEMKDLEEQQKEDELEMQKQKEEKLAEEKKKIENHNDDDE